MSSDTPRTDEMAKVYARASSFIHLSRELERENNALRANVAKLEQDKARLESEVLDAIEDAARGACHTAKQEREHNGIAAGSLITDSGAISANAENLRRLAEAKRFRIIRDFGRMVIGYWPENDPNRSKQLT